ncbi:MAG: hypothetical protein LQ338_006680 [Usnochroma carphineum]|nr:MAG: hypothetical protein LQ338_006680 [Usnochroma carphineum]
MYISPLAEVLSIAVALAPLLVYAIPAPSKPASKQIAPSGLGNDFLGSLTWYSQQPDLVLATISNNSTTNYAILAKNNLFDDTNAYQPFSVTTLSGTPVTLVGTRYPYADIDDSQFRSFPVGAVWERYFNMSEYMPPSPLINAPASQCFIFSLPSKVETLNLDEAKPGQLLADLFLTYGIAQVTVDSNPIHMNVTVPPGTPTATALGATQSLPAEPSGLFFAPSQPTGSVTGLLQSKGSSSSLDSNSFEIGGTS